MAIPYTLLGTRPLAPGKTLRCLFATVMGIALGPSGIQAATITLTATDAYGITSFNAAGHWSNGAPPTSGNAYVDTGFVVRTPPYTTGSFTFAGDSLTINGGGTLAFKYPATFTINNLILDGAKVSNWELPSPKLAGNITLGSGGAVLSPNFAQANFTITASISGSGGLTTDEGPGIVTLSAANTYSGNTTISTANLQLNNANAAQNSTVIVNMDNGLVFGNGIGTFNLGGLAGSNQVTLADTASNPVTLHVGGNDQTTMFGGTLVGSGGLTKTGAGMMTLTGTNNYGGGTTVSGGTLGVPGALLGGGPVTVDSGGAASLNGAGQLLANSLWVGNSGVGNFTQTGGINTVTNNLDLGFNSGGNGTYSLTGTGQLSAPAEYIGSSGTGSFVQSGGTNAVANGGGGLCLGYAHSSSGTYSLNGMGQLSAVSEWIGNSGTGNFTQSGGINTVTNNLDLGFNSGATGLYSLSGTGQLSSPVEYIGPFGMGNFTQSGGMNSSGSLSLGYSVSGSGTYNLNGGILALSALTQGLGAAAFNFNGGTLQAAGGFSTSQPMALGTSGGGATFDTTGYTVTLVGSLSGPGSLTKVDSGILTLTGSNTYTGPTTINQGKLIVDGWLTNSSVTVNSGGTLSGIGGLTSVTINAGGQLAPGDSLGVLSLSGSLTLATGAVMDYDLDGLSTGNEVLMPTGQLVLSGQQFSDFNFTPLAGFGPGTYTLIDAGSISGSLGTSTSGMIGGYAATLTVQNNNDLILNVTPEPSTLVLLGVGAVGLLGYVAWQRKRRRFSASLFLAGAPPFSLDDKKDLQEDGPATLSLPSRWAKVVRRAA